MEQQHISLPAATFLETNDRDELVQYSYVEERQAQELQCPVCLDPFVDPVELMACQHSFCKACIQQLPTPTCPTCRTLFLPSSIRVANPIIKRLVDGLEVYCLSKKEGCNWKGPRERLKYHLKDECTKVSHPCRYHYRGCAFKGTCGELEEHLSQEEEGASATASSRMQHEEGEKEEEEEDPRGIGATAATRISRVPRCRFNLMEPYVTQLEVRAAELEDQLKKMQELLDSSLAHQMASSGTPSFTFGANPLPSSSSSSSLFAPSDWTPFAASGSGGGNFSNPFGSPTPPPPPSPFAGGVFGRVVGGTFDPFVPSSDDFANFAAQHARSISARDDPPSPFALPRALPSPLASSEDFAGFVAQQQARSVTRPNPFADPEVWIQNTGGPGGEEEAFHSITVNMGSNIVSFEELRWEDLKRARRFLFSSGH